MRAVTPTTQPNERRGIGRSVNPRTRVACCAVLVVATLAWALSAPSTVAFAAALVSVLVTVAVLAGLEETFSVHGTEIRHRTWLRSVTIDAKNLSAIELPDVESSARELLMVDADGQSISVPLSRMHDNDEFSRSLAALLESTPGHGTATTVDLRGRAIRASVDAAA